MSLLCRSLSSSLSSSSSSSLLRSLIYRSPSSFFHRHYSASTDSSPPLHHSTGAEECYVWGQKGAFLNGLLPSNILSSADLTAPQFAPSPNPHSAIRSVSVGRYHHAIVTEDGKVYTWGNGESGQLGHGKTEALKTPSHIQSLPAAQAVACGGYHTLILDRSGHVWTVGFGGKFFGIMAGGLGHGNWTSISTPKQVEGLKDIVSISAGNYSSYALAKDGTVYAWGRGEFGVLGSGGSGNEKTPIKISSLESSPVNAIRSGPFFNAVITDKGELLMFGKNDQCQLGLGAGLSMDIYSMESVPTSVDFTEAKAALKEYLPEFSNDNQIVDASCGTNHTIAVNKNGHCFYWGNRLAMVPRLIRGDKSSFLKEKIVACAAGHQYSLFADNKGHLFSMGEGSSQCLGTGTRSNLSSPSLIPGFGPSVADFNPFGPVSRVFAGYTNAAVITASKKK